MEENLFMLETFLEDVYHTQHQTDILLFKLNEINNSHRLLYQQIEHYSDGRVTLMTIMQYWDKFNNDHELAANLEQQESSILIIGNYLGISRLEDIDLQKFTNSFLPKSQLENPHIVNDGPQADQQLYEGYTDIFCHTISTIITGFNKLQATRKKLSKYSQSIQNYFNSKYDRCYSFLTKQILLQFMQHRQIYTLNKFKQICWYIFGQKLNCISWDTFLNQECQLNNYGPSQDTTNAYDYTPLVLQKNQQTCKQKTESYLNLKLNGDWNQEADKSHQTKQQQKRQSNKQHNQGVSQILAQIDQIQLKFKEKLRKNNNQPNNQFAVCYKDQMKVLQVLKIAPFQSQKANGRYCSRRDSSQVGKLVNRTNYNRQPLAHFTKYSQSYRSQQKNVQKQYDFCSKQEQSQYIGHMYNKYFKLKNENSCRPSKISNKKQYVESFAYQNEGVSSLQNYRKVLNSSASQASLKIKQIEKAVAHRMIPKQTKVSYLSTLGNSNKYQVNDTNDCYSSTWNRANTMIRQKSTARLINLRY